MREFIQIASVFFGTAISFLVGDVTPLLIALISLVVVDYITGVLKAIIRKQLNSEVGYKGIVKKVMIFLVVVVANILDENVIGEGSTAKSIVITFYLFNEATSIIENIGACGVPIPQKLKDIIKTLNDTGERRRRDD